MERDVVRAHARRLGFAADADYVEWCRLNGFAPPFRKRPVDLERERARRREERAAERARSSRRARGPIDVLERTLSGELVPDDVRDEALRPLCDSIVRVRERADGPTLDAVCGVVRAVERGGLAAARTAFADRSFPFSDALVAIAERWRQWIRPLSEWRAPSRNRERRFASLLRHLLAKYPVPAFFDSAWFRREEGSYRQRDAWIHVALGGNVRTSTLRPELSKREAHHFLQAPDDSLVEHAIRWGQIHALGGDAHLARAVVGSRIGATFGDERFWGSVLRFLADNPLLDRAYVAPIVDYLEHHRRVRPNLSMRGRTVPALLAEVDRWHGRLAREGGPDFSWEPSGVDGFAWKTGSGDARREWSVVELLSRSALVAEGRAMRHCVATYADSCRGGRCSIWSMRCVDAEGPARRQTIEVDRDGVVVQARGKSNARPGPEERDVLRRWARAAGLVVASYV